jgi:GntR family histidine utilization transcriptional repressor
MLKSGGRSLQDLIRLDIEERIMSGEWLPGFRIPFEHQIMKKYACSRMTVNKALIPLVEKGLIDRRRRAGTFVAAPAFHRLSLKILDIKAEILGTGRTYDFKLHYCAERSATLDDKLALSIASGQVMALTCIHYSDDRPFAFEKRLINLSLAAEARFADFRTTPPGSWLLAHIPWSESRHRISAVAADDSQARHLGVELGHTCISIERWTWRLSERITYVQQLYPGDAYALEAHFRSP